MPWKSGYDRHFPRLFPGWMGSIGLAVLVVSAVACASEPAVTPALSPVAVQTPKPTGESTPASTPTAEISTQTSPTLPPTLTPEPATAMPTNPTVTPTIPIEESLTLQVLTPLDSIGVEVGAVRVAGITSGNEIGINGIPVEVFEDGAFQRDLTLSDGVNLMEVTASAPGRQSTSRQLVVFYVSPTAVLPFTLLYPPDGLAVSQPEVNVMGVTTLDSIVGVNQVPVEINSLGVFSASVASEEGANLVEVVATNIEGNIRFQTVAVFYTP